MAHGLFAAGTVIPPFGANDCHGPLAEFPLSARDDEFQTFLGFVRRPLRFASGAPKAAIGCSG
jgi:hypothetical protein